MGILMLTADSKSNHMKKMNCSSITRIFFLLSVVLQKLKNLWKRKPIRNGS